jgi:hypothetical protein
MPPAPDASERDVQRAMALNRVRLLMAATDDLNPVRDMDAADAVADLNVDFDALHPPRLPDGGADPLGVTCGECQQRSRKTARDDVAAAATATAVDDDASRAFAAYERRLQFVRRALPRWRREGVEPARRAAEEVTFAIKKRDAFSRRRQETDITAGAQFTSEDNRAFAARLNRMNNT